MPSQPVQLDNYGNPMTETAEMAVVTVWTEAGKIIDKKFLLYWISGIMMVICGIIGLLGNIFTLAVLCRPKMRKNVFYNLLLALACFDTLFILSYGIRYGFTYFWLLHEFIDVEWLYPISMFCLIGSIYMTVAISMERYLGICHPQIQFSRGPLVFIFPVLLITFGLAYNQQLIDPITIEDANPKAYRFWISVVFLTIIPLISLLFFNGSIIAIIKGRKNLQRTQNSHERNSTKILFGIVLIFLIFHIPRVVQVYYFYYANQNAEYFNSLFVSKPIAALALMMNSSVNFIIYSMVGSNFRAEFVQIFRCKKNPTENVSTTGTGDILSLENF